MSLCPECAGSDRPGHDRCLCPTADEQPGARDALIAAVIVGVGGEHDPCVTQAQAERTADLILRTLDVRVPADRRHLFHPPSARLLDDGIHFEWRHICAGGRPDTVTMPHGGGTWRVVQADPLTVVPSINCTACGTHGWITDGEWVPA